MGYIRSVLPKMQMNCRQKIIIAEASIGKSKQ
jgi:hypothetical protein